MTEDRVIEFVGDWLLFGSTIVFLVFMLLYNQMAPWEKSHEGRHMMGLAMAVLLTLTLGDLAVLKVEYPGRGYARIAVFLMMLAVGIGQLRLLWLAQRKRRDVDRHERERRDARRS